MRYLRRVCEFNWQVLCTVCDFAYCVLALAYCVLSLCVLCTVPLRTAYCPFACCVLSLCVLRTVPLRTAHCPFVCCVLSLCVLSLCVLRTVPLRTAYCPFAYCPFACCVLSLCVLPLCVLRTVPLRTVPLRTAYCPFAYCVCLKPVWSESFRRQKNAYTISLIYLSLQSIVWAYKWKEIKVSQNLNDYMIDHKLLSNIKMFASFPEFLHKTRLFLMHHSTWLEIIFLSMGLKIGLPLFSCTLHLPFNSNNNNKHHWVKKKL